MISNLIRYSYVATRVRGIYANFLKEEDYQQLLKARDLSEFEKALRKIYPTHGAPGALQQVPGQAQIPDSSSLEDRIVAHFLDITGKIMRWLPDAQRAFLGALVLEYEIFNVKALLRGRILGTPTEKIRQELIALGIFAQWDWEELLAEDEIPQILHSLRARPLGPAITQAYLDRYLKTHSTYPLESQIDIEYLTWLYDGTRKFGKEEGGLLERWVGQRVDVTNVSWILRFRENFKMSGEEILVQLVPRGHFLDLRALKDLAFAEDPKLMLARLGKYPWKKYLPADRLNLPVIEAGLDRYLKEQYYKIFRQAPMHFAGVAAFVMLAQAVAEDLVKILEASEYRLASDSVQPQLYFLNK